MNKSDRYDWEWSERHVRLKYQMVLSSVAFWLLCRFELREEWTFVFLPIDGIPNRLELIVIAIIFYGFMVFSFIIQSKNERNHFDIRFRIFDEAAKEKASVFERLENAFNAGVRVPFVTMEKEFSYLRSLKSAAEDAKNQMLTDVHTWVGVLRKLSKEPAEYEIELREAVQQFYQNNPSTLEQFFKSREELLQRNSDKFKQIARSSPVYTGDQIWNKIEMVADSLSNDAVNPLANISVVEGDLEVAGDKFEETISECERKIPILKSQAEKMLSDLKASSDEMVAELNEFVTKTRLEGESANNFISLGRDRLDYWSPIIVSNLFIIHGFYSLISNFWPLEFRFVPLV